MAVTSNKHSFVGRLSTLPCGLSRAVVCGPGCMDIVRPALGLGCRDEEVGVKLMREWKRQMKVEVSKSV